MDNYNELCERINEALSDKRISNLRREYQNISSKYRAERANSSTMVATGEEVVSYLSTRMAETAIIADHIFSKLDLQCDFKKSVQSVLDLGSGTGSCLWALDNHIHNKSIVAVEREAIMLKYSKLLSNSLSNQIKYVHNNILSSEISSFPEFDLVVESFVLNEMTENDCEKTVNLMCRKSKEFIILIEPGTPTSYMRMMKVRRQILNEGFKLILPCPHEKECGLFDDYCNFSVRVSRTQTSRQVKGGTLNYEDEKFFYLVFKKNNDSSTTFNSTIIRRPVYRKGCVDLKLCKSDGSIESKTITKSNKENYKLAKELKHGDGCAF